MHRLLFDIMKPSKGKLKMYGFYLTEQQKACLSIELLGDEWMEIRTGYYHNVCE